MNFLKCIYLHKPHTYRNIEQFHPQRVPLYLFPVNPSPPKKQHTVLTAITINCFVYCKISQKWYHTKVAPLAIFAHKVFQF